MAEATMTREDLLQLVRESGVLEELADEVRSIGPAHQFAADDEGFVRLEQGLGSGGFPWNYWRKKDGTVITGPEPRETLYPIYQRKGYTHMPQYGALPTPGSPLPCCRGFMRTDQFHVLLAKGGAKEMSLSQILAAGWHLKPPVIHGKPATFPQLKGIAIEDVEGDECGKRR